MDKIEYLLSLLEPDKYNISSEFTDEELLLLGDKVIKEFELDERSRSQWSEMVSESMKLAKQVCEKKSFPFDGASNVKYPLITLATIQLAANTGPQLVHNNKVVEVSVVGDDQDGQKQAKADRVRDYMSYQLLIESDTWEEGMDRLLHSWPVVGTSFKKIYYDPFIRKPCFELCAPEDIIINNNVKSLESARRVSHRMWMHKNDIVERMRAGIFRDIEIEKLTLTSSTTSPLLTDASGRPISNYNTEDEDSLHEIVEQHRFLDLDDDGYQEPYIVTVHKNSKQVLRVYPRFTAKGIIPTPDNKVKKILPKSYFVDYHFIPSPDTSFYSIGFGTLLNPINKSINSLINQLIDSGTYSNTQAGLVGRDLKLTESDLKVQMGRLQVVGAGNGVDIAKSVFLFPFKEPSQVLFSLLGLMIQTGEKLANITEIITGTTEIQNVPATTMLEAMRQGLKVFSSIQKRLYRSQRKELKILYELNAEYADPETFIRLRNSQFSVFKEDFEGDDLSINPVADPTISSSSEKLARLNAIPTIKQIFPAESNGAEMLKEYMEGLDFKDVDRFVVQPDPNAPPSPDDQKKMAEAEAKIAGAENDKLLAISKLKDSDTKSRAVKIKEGETKFKIQKMKADSYESLHKANMDIHASKVEEDKLLLEQQKILVSHEKNQIAGKKQNANSKK